MLQELAIIQKQVNSADRVIQKTLFRSPDGALFETSNFLIHDRGRLDICISSMAGCSMGCLICATTYSDQQFQRVLSAGEMMFQVLSSLERTDIPENYPFRIGFMGNGEPFLNIDNVITTINLLVDQFKGRLLEIAISTIGVTTDPLDRLIDIFRGSGAQIKVQYSLFHINDEQRKIVLPKSPNLENVVMKFDNYSSMVGIPVRYNYPLITGFNNSNQDVQRIIDFFKDHRIDRRLKLSVFNSFPGSRFIGVSDEELINFYNQLREHIVVDLFFGNRDSTILASCGQMRSGCG